MYKCGQEVMRCQPFVYAIKSAYRNKVCDWCLKLYNEVDLKPCSRCLYVHYCNKSCQASAWKSHHKFECKISFWFTKSESKLQMANTDKRQHYFYTIIYRHNIQILVRLISKLSHGGHEYYTVLPNGEKRFFENLISNKDEFAKNASWLKDFKRVYEILKSFENDGYIKVPSEEKLLEMYAKYWTNANQMCFKFGKSTNDIGNWLFLDYSAFDHSCAPNATWYINEGINRKEIIVRAIEDVDKFENLRFSYLLNLFEPKEIRRESLMKSHHFHCECTKCLDEESEKLKSSILCPNCEDNGCIPISSRICMNCNLEIDIDSIEEHKDLKSLISTEIKENKGLEIHMDLYKKSVAILHPYDSDFMRLLIELFNELQCNKSLQYEVGKLIMKNYEKDLPKYYTIKGTMEINLTNVCHALALAKIKDNKLHEAEALFYEALIHITSAQNILIVSRGNDHSHLELCKRLKENIESEIKSIAN